MKAPDGSRFVVAVFGRGELIAEVFIDGPETVDDEDIGELLETAGRQYAATPDYPESRRRA